MTKANETKGECDNAPQSPKSDVLSKKTIDQDADAKKDKIRELIKRKLKPIHQEIIAPPGQ